MATATSSTAAGTRNFQSFLPATGTSATFTALDDVGGASAGGGTGCWRRWLGDRRLHNSRAAFLCDRHRAGSGSYGSSYLRIPLQPLQLGTHFRGVVVTDR